MSNVARIDLHGLNSEGKAREEFRANLKEKLMVEARSMLPASKHGPKQRRPLFQRRVGIAAAVLVCFLGLSCYVGEATTESTRLRAPVVEQAGEAGIMSTQEEFLLLREPGIPKEPAETRVSRASGEAEESQSP